MVEGALSGYEVKLWHHDVNKPIVYGIHAEKKPRHFLDDYLRSKKNVPSPHAYTTAKDLLSPHNPMYAKSPRVTVAVEIEKQAKKKNFPEPTTYSPQMKLVQAHRTGCFSFKADRSGYIDECKLKGAISPPFAEKNYIQVDPNMKYPRIHKPVAAKPVSKTNLSPASYNADESFKSTQEKKPRFYISKYKYENYLTRTIKNRKWVPGIGSYDHDKGKNFVTKGLSRGWK